MRNISGLRPYKPGQSGNPSGKKSYTSIPKVIKQYTATLVSETYNKLINMKMTDLRVLSRSMTAPAIEVIVARAMIRELSDGTLHRTETVLDRIIGKVPQKQEVSGTGGAPLMPPQIVISKHESLPEPKLEPVQLPLAG